MPKDGSLQSLIFHPMQRRTVFKDIPELNFKGGDGVKVVVIDSGVNKDVSVDDRIDYTGFGTYDSIPGTHGTLVADIVRHFAKNAHITSIKVAATRNNIDWDLVFRALKHAKEIGAHIVNLSIGHTDTRVKCRGKCIRCAEFQAFVENTGIMVVASAGNSGDKDNTLACPSMAPDIISVGLVNEVGTGVDRISSRSRPGMMKPNLLASGYVERKQNPKQWGTSFSAPVVTGVLAAALPAYIGNTPMLLDTLYRACKKLESVPVHHQGHGVLDLKRFVEEMQNEKTAGDNQQQSQSE